MAHDIFLRVAGIEGSSKYGERAGWIRLLSFTHAIEQPMSGSAQGGGGVSAGRAVHGDFTVLKDVDVTSPALALYCCRGDKIGRVTLDICDSANQRAVYMQYEMSDVYVRRVAPELSVVQDIATETLAREQVSFRYGRIQWAFFEVDGSAQATGNDSIHYWDAQSNQGG